MAPIAPACSNPGKSQLQPHPTTPTAVLSAFATHQIQNSQNQQSATVLFTPHTTQHTDEALVWQQQPSPMPQSIQPPAHSTLHPSFPSTLHPAYTRSDSSESESEKSLETTLAALDIHSQSSSGSSSPHPGPHSRY
jgi:hypothetical protein